MPIEISSQQTMRQLEKAAKAIRAPALTSDIYEAMKYTWKYYVKTHMHKRFAGRRHNPTYPRITLKYSKWKFKNYGARPLLVLTGLMRTMVLRSAKVRQYRKNKFAIKIKAPIYSEYLKDLGFRFVEPNRRELKQMEKYFYRKLSELRKKRIQQL